MKTICVLNNRIIMSQEGDALETMTANAKQHPGAEVSVVTDDKYESLKAAQRTFAEVNATILAKIIEIDLKRIRPLAEGDAVFLANLNAEIAVLGEQMIPPRKPIK